MEATLNLGGDERNMRLVNDIRKVRGTRYSVALVLG
jgi:hypothetical protein